jgi:hypothetical protein
MNLTQVPQQKLMVEHADSLLRFWVKSRSQSDVAHLVDLGSDDYPDGECTCKHFECVCGPSQKRGEHRVCQHIVRARDALTDWIIPILKQQDKNRDA